MIKYFFILTIILVTSSLKAQQWDTIRVSGLYNRVALDKFIAEVESTKQIRVFYKKEWIEGLTLNGDFSNVSLSNMLVAPLASVGLVLKRYDASNFVILPDDGITIQSELSELSTGVPSKQKMELETMPERVKTHISIGSGTVDVNSEAILKGVVTDGKNGETLAGATIYFPELEIGTRSNAFGYFELQIPEGDHRVQFSFIGYETEMKLLTLKSDAVFDVELFEATRSLESVTITDRAFDANVRGLELGVEKLSIGTLKKLPRIMGEVDVVKSLVLLPGVTTVGEGTSSFNVRGGSVGENLILQDQALIFNSSHLFGFFSAFNPDIVRNVTLYKGGAVPSTLGGRLSSILDVELIEGNLKQVKAKGGLGMIMSKLSVEGPIIKDQTTFLVSGRVSYTDWLLRSVKNNAAVNKSAAGFDDFNAKLVHLFGGGDKVVLSGYRSSDHFRFANDTTYRYNTALVSAEWLHQFSRNVIFSTTGAVGSYDYHMQDRFGVNQFDLRAFIDYKSVDAKLDIEIGKNNLVMLGTQNNWYKIDNGNYTPNQVSLDLEQIDNLPEQSIESAYFFSSEWTLTDWLSFTAGLRYSTYKNFGANDVYVYQSGLTKSTDAIIDTIRYSSGKKIKSYSGLEPRMALRVNLTETSSLKLGFNRMRQYLHLISNTVAVTPIDVWQLSNTHIKPAISDQFVLGYFRNFEDNMYETSAEVYFKRTKDIVDYKGGARLLVNKALETDLLAGTGRAAGLELLLRKVRGRLSGWVSYTFSRSRIKVNGDYPEEIINNGEYYATNYDKPHDLTVVSEYKLGKRISVNVNFTYSTGRPVTAAESSYTQGRIKNLANYSNRNEFRIPDYHRLDVALTIDQGFKKKRKYKGEWAFSIYNLYGRKNAYSVFFDKHSNPFKLSVLSALISISYNFNIG